MQVAQLVHVDVVYVSTSLHPLGPGASIQFTVYTVPRMVFQYWHRHSVYLRYDMMKGCFDFFSFFRYPRYLCTREKKTLHLTKELHAHEVGVPHLRSWSSGTYELSFRLLCFFLFAMFSIFMFFHMKLFLHKCIPFHTISTPFHTNSLLIHLRAGRYGACNLLSCFFVGVSFLQTIKWNCTLALLNG